MLITLAWDSWLVGIFTVLFLLVSVLMILTVLIQRPQGGGLAGAFGSGAGSGQTAFGTKTGDALTIFTIIVFVAFIGTAIALNYGYRPSAPDPAEAESSAATPAGTAPGTTAPATNTPAGQAPANGQAPAPVEQPSEKPADPGTTQTPPTTPPAAPPATPDKPAEAPKTPETTPAEQPK